MKKEWHLKCRKILNKVVDITISIVSYGNRVDIEKCLKSLSKTCSFFDSLKIYIINNKIGDSLGYFSKKYSNVLVIDSQKNGGYGYGHNQILTKINSRYHVILNPDIIFTENSLKKLKEYMDRHHDVAMCTPEIRNTNGNVQHLPQRYPKLKYVLASTIPGMSRYRNEYTNSQITAKNYREIDVCTGCFMFIRTGILKGVNGFDERFFMYFEDFDLSRRVKNFGRIIYIPKTKVIHKWNRESKKSIKMFFIQVTSMFKFYSKVVK